MAEGSNANASLYVGAKGTGSVRLSTSSTSLIEQARVSHTASAVNYVQVTGAATGGFPTISTQGSDASVALWLTTKGTSATRFLSQNGSYTQLRIDGSVASANSLNVIGGASGFGAVLSVQGADANIPLVLQPLGTGALQAQQTDSTATGGNARGANAVDWQTHRYGAGSVASGTYSVIGGGDGNTSGGYGSSLAGGVGNNASNNYSFVGGGNGNSAGNDRAIVAGGGSNSALGILNFIGGGFTNSGTTNTAVTTQSATMNGTTAVTLAASNASIKVGQYISGTSIAGDTYVAAISGTSLTLSKVASGSSTSTLSFYTPHGVVVGGGNNQATGSYSFIGGGGDAGTASNRNVASGDYSFVGGGRTNIASGIASVVVGGGFDGGSSALGHTASGTGSTVGGGLANAASGTGATVVGGYQSSATGAMSTILGGRYGNTRSIEGLAVISACNQPIASATGISQSAVLVIARQTTDATPTVLASSSSAATTNNQVILPNNSAYYFRGEVVAGVTGGGNTKGWTIEGLIKRGAGVGTTTLIGSTVTSSYADAGASTWTIALSADTTNGGLAVTFTGQAATTIRTVCSIRTTEMTY